jgi:hypothetical protein
MALFVYENILLILQELLIIFQIFIQWIPKLPSVRGFVEHREHISFLLYIFFIMNPRWTTKCNCYNLFKVLTTLTIVTFLYTVYTQYNKCVCLEMRFG